jgi:Zn-dependent M28 family amino/carboxypeptidase
VRREELGREVRFVFFGAEEWGLRGSRAYVEARRKSGLPAFAINADTVGRVGKNDVHVLGTTHHARLARIVSAALEQAGLEIGRDIDRFAYAHGSDHWTLHEAGVPSIGLWSGDYQVMHTKADTPDGVDPAKIERIARALAMAALAISGTP